MSARQTCVKRCNLGVLLVKQVGVLRLFLREEILRSERLRGNCRWRSMKAIDLLLCLREPLPKVGNFVWIRCASGGALLQRGRSVVLKRKRKKL